MPRLEKIVIQNWRNIELQELEFSPNMNCICSGNGEGKTNLLDAIYYLSMTKSAFSTSDKYNFRKGTSEFAMSGTYDMENGTRTKINIKVTSDGDKKLTRDGKTYAKTSEHIGLLPIVMVSPSDGALVSEGSELRRKFVSSVLSQLKKEHLSALQKYNRMLSQRNALLKSDKCTDELLDSIDYTLNYLAESISKDRASLTEKLRPRIQTFYNELASCKENIDIQYISDAQKAPLIELLSESRKKDRLLGFTSCGIQRDDFLFIMNDAPIRKIGSQGQQKCFLVALKFAQYAIMKDIYGYAPMLLLDDLFDKLDTQRTENLLQMVSGEDFGQIFLSDTNTERIKEILDKFTCESSYYKVSQGEFHK
mgnify:CR=1 FL=1